MNTFSAGAMIRFGWETFKKRPWFFVGIQIVILVVGGIGSQLTGQVDKAHTGVALVGALVAVFVGVVVQILLKMGAISFSLKANESPEALTIQDMWAPAQFWNFLLTSVVYGVIVVVGLILLIVPGIMWALRFIFAQYLVIDRGLDMSAALTESTRITNGHKWELLLLVIMIVGINIVGAIALFVGLLVSLPVSMFAVAHAYRTLESAAGAVVPQATV